ncbi:hypothetical protein BH10CHL1_BH10CHL1_12570 [soil metagenome]
MAKKSSNSNIRSQTEATEQEIGGHQAHASEQASAPPYEKPPRQPSVERENAFNALAWLIEGATGVIEELRHNDLGLSETFWVHATAARKESLLALRAALDDLIERTDSQAQKEEEKQQRRERRGDINVDF